MRELHLPVEQSHDEVMVIGAMDTTQDSSTNPTQSEGESATGSACGSANDEDVMVVGASSAGQPPTPQATPYVMLVPEESSGATSDTTRDATSDSTSGTTKHAEVARSPQEQAKADAEARAEAEAKAEVDAKAKADAKQQAAAAASAALIEEMEEDCSCSICQVRRERESVCACVHAYV
jgi:hypothetical protein